LLEANNKYTKRLIKVFKNVLVSTNIAKMTMFVETKTKKYYSQKRKFARLLF